MLYNRGRKDFGRGILCNVDPHICSMPSPLKEFWMPRKIIPLPVRPQRAAASQNRQYRAPRPKPNSSVWNLQYCWLPMLFPSVWSLKKSKTHLWNNRAYDQQTSCISKHAMVWRGLLLEIACTKGLWKASQAKCLLPRSVVFTVITHTSKFSLPIWVIATCAHLSKWSV